MNRDPRGELRDHKGKNCHSVLRNRMKEFYSGLRRSLFETATCGRINCEGSEARDVLGLLYLYKYYLKQKNLRSYQEHPIPFL